LISEEEAALKPGLEKSVLQDKPGLELPAAEQISHFMNRVQQAYAMYFNAKYVELVKQGKKAPVFEGRFKAKEITDQDYLAQVSYYIRHNAVKHGVVENVEEWPWAGSTEREGFPAMDYTGMDAEFDPGFE
jgi:nitrate reductase assembly molybdenum cofactor insertion protein NarJ